MPPFAIRSASSSRIATFELVPACEASSENGKGAVEYSGSDWRSICAGAPSLSPRDARVNASRRRRRAAGCRSASRALHSFEWICEGRRTTLVLPALQCGVLDIFRSLAFASAIGPRRTRLLTSHARSPRRSLARRFDLLTGPRLRFVLDVRGSHRAPPRVLCMRDLVSLYYSAHRGVRTPGSARRRLLSLPRCQGDVLLARRARTLRGLRDCGRWLGLVSAVAGVDLRLHSLLVARYDATKDLSAGPSAARPLELPSDMFSPSWTTERRTTRGHEDCGHSVIDVGRKRRSPRHHPPLRE